MTFSVDRHKVDKNLQPKAAKLVTSAPVALFM